MTCRLDAVRIDAADPVRLAGFWAALLGWSAYDDGVTPRVTLVPSDDTGFRLRLVENPAEKLGANQMHFDLTSNDRDQDETVTRALALGARHIDVGQTSQEHHVVLADPEGNELCVIEPGNRFLADCGLIGALSSDGTQAVGYFWSEALGWPLVWDQDQETAIRSPHGGPTITWGGPPVAPKQGPNRLRFELVADDDLAAEIDRLVSLGGTRLEAPGDSSVAMADPDGNEFTILPSALTQLGA